MTRARANHHERLLGISLGLRGCLLRQFNWKAFHAAGQCYRDASHRCSVVVSGIHLAPAAITLTAATVSNAEAMITKDTWGMARSPQGLGVPLFPLFQNRADRPKAL